MTALPPPSLDNILAAMRANEHSKAERMLNKLFPPESLTGAVWLEMEMVTVELGKHKRATLAGDTEAIEHADFMVGYFIKTALKARNAAAH